MIDRSLLAAAERGDVNAQFSVGLFYSKAPHGSVLAVSWYQKAAMQGHTGAMNNLGACYMEGSGVTKDVLMAINLYRKAAERGNVTAQSNLADCYADGTGVAQDQVEAVRLYRRAAAKGHPSALFNLALRYEEGNGVIRDEIEAYACYNLAGVTMEAARKRLNSLEADLPMSGRLRGQQRSRQLKREIESMR